MRGKSREEVLEIKVKVVKSKWFSPEADWDAREKSLNHETDPAREGNSMTKNSKRHP